MSTESTSGLRIEAPAPGTELFDRAKTLGDSQSKSIGLLRHAAWDDYGHAGHILVAARGVEVLGYTAYRVPRNEVRLAHLVVATEARGQGVARALVEEITSRHSERRGIGLRCRRDLAAHNVWPKLGFVSIGERLGRGSDRQPLTEWWYDFGHPDLLSWAPGDSTVTAVVDTNIFIDLHASDLGDESLRTQQLIESLLDRVNLVVTPELFNELNRQPDAQERQRLMNVAQALPTLRARATDVDVMAKDLQAGLGAEAVSEQDRSDVRHVAWAAVAGVSLVITRDYTARRRLQQAAQEIAGVTICEPSTLVAVVHEREEAGDYSPVAFSGTEFQMQDVSSNPELADSFLNTAVGERRKDYRARLARVSAGAPDSRLSLVTDSLDSPTALIGAIPTGKCLYVTVARISLGALEQTLAAQLLQTLRSHACAVGCSAIVLQDPHSSGAFRKACQSDGFIQAEGTDVALVVDQRARLDTLQATIASATEGLKEAQAAAVWAMVERLSMASPAALEHALRPLRVLDADLPTWLVPIKPHWASDLFGYPAMLMPRQNTLGLSTEHVYYKRGKAGEKSPGRILWYVSGLSEVFACSLLVDVRDEKAKDLFRMYGRLGVYKYKDVLGVVGPQGTARALNVTDTELFRRPISLDRVRSLAAMTGDSINVVGSKKVSQALFEALIKEGHDEA